METFRKDVYEIVASTFEIDQTKINTVDVCEGSIDIYLLIYDLNAKLTEEYESFLTASGMEP